MPFRFSPDSKSEHATLRGRLKQLSRQTSRHVPAMSRVSRLSIGAPHAVYDVRLDALASGRGLDGLKPTSYRYLIKSGGRTVSAAEMRGRAGVSTVSSVNFGKLVAATSDALEDLSVDPRVLRGGYEARLLRCAAIYLCAVWLKSDDRDPDLVYPVATSINGLQERVYTVKEFLDAVRPIAKKRLSGVEFVLPKPRRG